MTAATPRWSVLAPAWLVEVIRPKRAPIPWAKGARAFFGPSVPLAFGVTVAPLAPTLIVAIGALIASVTAQGGPYRSRFVRLASILSGGALGWLIGQAVGRHSWWTAAAIVAVAGVSAIVSNVGNVASTAALQLLVMSVVSTAVAFAGPVWEPSLLFMIGGAWVLALSLVGGARDRSRPERAAVAAIYRAMADQLDGLHAGDETEPQAVTPALEAAYESLLTVRLHDAGRDPRTARLMFVLDAGANLSEALEVAARDRPLPPPAVGVALRAAADTIELDAPLPDLPILAGWPAPPGASATVGSVRLRRALSTVRDLLEGPPPDPTTGRSGWGLLRWLRRTLEALRPGRMGAELAVRLMLCVGLAEVAQRELTLTRSYWITLTVAIILKPDFGSVFARAIQRGTGTVIGAVLGAGVLALFPNGGGVVPFVAVFAALAAIGTALNYGMFATFLTPVVLILIELPISHQNHQVVVARLEDTILGCAIVLVIGYLLWPDARRVQVSERLGEAFGSIEDYLDRVFTVAGPERRALRRQTVAHLRDAEVSLQQALSSPAGSRAAALAPLLAGLERLAAITYAAVSRLDPPGTPAPPGSHEVGAAIADLRDSLAERRPPRDLPLPDDGPLAPVSTEVRSLRSLVAGPRAPAGLPR